MLDNDSYVNFLDMSWENSTQDAVNKWKLYSFCEKRKRGVL